MKIRKNMLEICHIELNVMELYHILDIQMIMEKHYASTHKNQRSYRYILETN